MEMKSNNFLKYLTERHKLSLRNIRTGQEIWHIFTSRLNIVIVSLTMIVLLFVAILTIVAYTPILDLIPGYPGNKARRLIVENIVRLDSLEWQVREWEQYNRKLMLILEGQAVPQSVSDSIQAGIKGAIVPRNAADSILRRQIETDSSYMLVEEVRKKTKTSFEMLTPVRGAVVKQFNPKEGIFGVEITPQPNQGIMSILDGTVILSTWDPNAGYTLVIEHADNMISMYKRISRALCSVGQKVSAGEAVAMTGTVVEGNAPHFVFELWSNGNPVDPENYITF